MPFTKSAISRRNWFVSTYNKFSRVRKYWLRLIDDDVLNPKTMFTLQLYQSVSDEYTISRVF